MCLIPWWWPRFKEHIDDDSLFHHQCAPHRWGRFLKSKTVKRMRVRVMGHLIIFVALRMCGTNQVQAVCRWAMRAATQFLERLRTLGVKVTHSFNPLQLQRKKWNITGDIQENCGNHFNWRKNKWQTFGFSSNGFEITKIQYLYVQWIMMQKTTCDSRHRLRSQSRRQFRRWGGSYRWNQNILIILLIVGLL